jgi:uncharacterized OB-fold protein
MTASVTKIETPIRLEYTYTPGKAPSRFLRALAERRLVGERCPRCSKVYVPPRGACAGCGIETEGEIDVADVGTITTFCVVNIPFTGQAVECPYVAASILLDGADVPIMHLIQEIPADEVRMGMRVEAVWVDPQDAKPSLESIKHFRPTGEADVALREVVARIREAG